MDDLFGTQNFRAACSVGKCPRALSARPIRALIDSVEQLNKEIRQHSDVVGIFPGRRSPIRPAGVVLAEQNDEWTEGRRYMSLALLAKAESASSPANPTPQPASRS